MNRNELNRLMDEMEKLVNYDSYLLNRSDQDSIQSKIQNLRDLINETHIKRGSENVE